MPLHDPTDLLHTERAFSTQELANIAQRLGWQHQRTTGSHQIFTWTDWAKHLCIPVHKEYSWGRAKAILIQILAPLRQEMPDVEHLLETVQTELMQLVEHFETRVAAYETQRFEEVEKAVAALHREASVLPTIKVQTQPLVPHSDSLPVEMARPANHEAPSRRDTTLEGQLDRLRQDLVRQKEALQQTRIALQTAQQQLAEGQVADGDRLAQLTTLQQACRSLKTSLWTTQIGSAVALVVFGAIAAGSFVLRPVCEPTLLHAPQREQF